jgi:hypothetical protein
MTKLNGEFVHTRLQPQLTGRAPLRLVLVACAVAGLTVTAALASTRQGDGRRDVTVPPASAFTANVDNVWFPLEPGSRYTYAGVKDGLPSRDVVTVLHQVRSIGGVPCAVVSDRLYLKGRLRERTTDWYSQDSQGNVWYFGEKTAELDAKGRVTSTEGTWKAGVGGAEPGIYMPAHPHVGQSGRQEFYRGHAEDHFKVIGRFSTVAGARLANAVLTEEWTPLEPGTLDHKLYVRGIGTVLEHTEQGGDEHAELVAIAG